MDSEYLFKELARIVSDAIYTQADEEEPKKVEIKTAIDCKKELEDLMARYDLQSKRIDSLSQRLEEVWERETERDKILGDVVYSIATLKQDMKKNCSCDECLGDCDSCHCNQEDFDLGNLDEALCEDVEDEDLEESDPFDDVINSAVSSVLAFLHCEMDNLKEEKEILIKRICKADTANEHFECSKKIDELNNKINYLLDLIHREEK